MNIRQTISNMFAGLSEFTKGDMKEGDVGTDNQLLSYKKEVEQQEAELKRMQAQIDKINKENEEKARLVQRQLANVQKAQRVQGLYAQALQGYAQAHLSVEAARQLYKEETNDLLSSIREMESMKPHEVVEEFYPDRDGTLDKLKQAFRNQILTQTASHMSDPEPEPVAPPPPAPKPTPAATPKVPTAKLEPPTYQMENIPDGTVKSPFTSRSAKAIMNGGQA